MRKPLLLVTIMAAMFITNCATNTRTQTTPSRPDVDSYRDLYKDGSEEPWQGSSTLLAPGPTDTEPQTVPAAPDAAIETVEVAEAGPQWTGRFVLRQLMPVVDPEMIHARQVYMGADPRVQSSELEPSSEGGITKTRVSVRAEKEDSDWFILDDQDPAYRMFVVIRWLEIVRALSWAGAEHILLGTLSFGGVTFDSDPSFPLHFKLVQDVGYVYLCGRGTVTTPDGATHSLGDNQQIGGLVSNLAAEDQLTREAACEALGWLVKTEEERDEAISALVKALGDDAMEVRRNAAAALGRIGDVRAREPLKAALQDADEWVREVVADALKKLEDV